MSIRGTKELILGLILTSCGILRMSICTRYEPFPDAVIDTNKYRIMNLINNRLIMILISIYLKELHYCVVARKKENDK